MPTGAKFKDEDSLGYRIDVIGRNVQITDAIRSYITEKLAKVERFHTHILHVHVTLEIQKIEHLCTLLLKIDHTQVKCQAISNDMYASIDKAVEKLQALLSRYKGRIQDHHKKKLSVIDMQVNVLHRPFTEIDDINAEIEAETLKVRMTEFAPPKILGAETRPLKTLSLDEAVMKMDLSGDQFLIFRSEEDRKLKVLYRRKDGNYGLIQPE